MASTARRATLSSVLAFLWLCTAPAVNAVAPAPPEAPHIDLVHAHAERATPLGEVALQIDPEAYERLWRTGKAIVPSFPIPELGSVALHLEQVGLVSSDAVFMVNDETGMHEHAGPSMRFFRGVVAGEPGSLVSLNLFQGRIGGFIYTGGQEFSIGPRSFDLKRPGAHEVSIRSELLAETEPVGRCDGEQRAPARITRLEEAAGSGKDRSHAEIDGTTLLKAFIAIEGTVEWVAHHGGAAAAETYTLNLLAQISAYWETDVLVRMEVPFSLMNTVESDGYTNGTEDTSILLPEMRTKWRTTPALQSVFRTAAQLFSKKASGGSGRAYLDTLCGGVSFPVLASDFGVNIISGGGGSWEKRLVGHEIGHNFSSPHTHCFAPEIDQCHNSEGGCFAGTEVQVTGTMMSYCDVRVSVIHQRAKDESLRPAAEAAFPTCVATVGEPGDVRVDGGGGLEVGKPNACGSESFQTDDGFVDSASGYLGTAQANWVKRFTPSCYPFTLTDVEMLTWHTGSVAVGRPVRIVVSVDPSGSGNPANATLVYTEDTTIQVVSSSSWNQYTLASPVNIPSGDMYVGFYDLVADAPDTYIMAYDNSFNGDSYRQANGTSPAGLALYGSGTYMIRASGGGISADAIELTWGQPCNDAAVPSQDFAVYQGSMTDFSSYTSLTCSTGRSTSRLLSSAPDNVFWLVVPNTAAAEGSYGLATSGQRAPAAAACKAQDIGACP